MAKRRFDFTLGPVQGFVAQARRTRDFWAGSFLLSWLAGVAMKATKAQSGDIIFPCPPEGYLEWIGGSAHGSAPTQGSVPNRFRASVPDGFSEQAVTDAVRAAWQALAEHVWAADIAPRLAGEAAQLARTRAIWDRQHAAFWETSWVTTTDPDESTGLDRRKNWRVHLPPQEPGMKCHLMSGWQELSGIDGIAHHHNEARRAFWQRFSTHDAMDFREGEQLCALAFVKRRFARYFSSFSATICVAGHAMQLKGWPVPVSQPSTACMAAARWLERFLLCLGEHPEEKAAVATLIEQGIQVTGRSEYATRLKCLTTAAVKAPFARSLADLDASLFFDELAAARHAGNPAQASAFGRQLAQIKRATGFTEAPAPYYAMLLMDGDQLGVHMSAQQNVDKIPAALNKFTTSAAETVAHFSGNLIYAGGDDVLAMLPLEDALPCAAALRAAYLDAFRDSGIPTTLSGAVVFAHLKTPLGEVLRVAHAVLDDVAKERTGRDAVAVQVLKPGGEHLTWAKPWARRGEEAAVPPRAGAIERLDALVSTFRGVETGTPGFSSKFFYKLRDRFELFGSGFVRAEQVALLRADFLASEPGRNSFPQHLHGMDQAAERAAWIDQQLHALIEHCTPEVRRMEGGAASVVPAAGKPLSADAVLLVRFLAQKGLGSR